MPRSSLIGSDFRVFQRHGGVADKPIGIVGTHRRELFILHVDNATGEVAIGAVIHGIDAQRLHIDPVAVHVGDALRSDRKTEAAFELPARGALELSPFYEIDNFGDGGVGVHVHGLDPAAADRHFPMLA